MRYRMSALVLSLILAMSFVACSKKNETQNQNPNQPATSSETSSAQGGQQMGNMSQDQSMAKTAPPQQQQQAAPGAAQAPAQQAAQAPPPPPPPPPPLVIAQGASLVVRMGSTIDTKTANPGDAFNGTLAHAVTVKGEVAIPAGAAVSGTVVDSKSPGRFKGEGVLSVALTAVNVGGVPMTIHSSTYTQTVKGKGKRTGAMIGGGAGGGALIGGLAGGGKGALIGGLVGAGAGTAGAAFTGNKDLQIPAESVVTFRLSRSLTVKQSAPAQ
ncbi:MAG TPA: hypothetical protein VL240_13505 [Candidatus Binatia bacterium]|nr:hypothetical protein [Candidatus Binatia bacterium]